MKKRIARILLSLALTLSLVGTAFAATETTVTTKDLGGGKTVTADLSEDKTYVDLTVTGLTSGEQYLVLMVSGICDDASEANITESTIRYIDQASADGSVTFKVFPNKMESSTILLSGKDVLLTIVATVEVPYLRGDANQDGEVTMSDATATARHAVKIPGSMLSGLGLAAAEVNNDNEVTMSDATKIAQYAVKIISSLD